MNEIEARLIDLKSDDPKVRYEAVLFFARYPKSPDFKVVYDEVWKLTEDPDERVVYAAGIAGSMISARNSPLFGMDYVQDFLVSWDDLNRGKRKDPTNDDWAMLRHIQDKLLGGHDE